MKEQYVVFPASSETENYRDINMVFEHLKQDIDAYFPSFVNVIGKGFYKDGDLQSIRIEFQSNFLGRVKRLASRSI